ncbi:YdfR family protein [Escherichia coli]|nr:YdfR family protein [Escherichia coli]EEV0056183.1 YdfR family protein [Escherichia coli]EEW6135238.1 YdfR family protein [Escherichia coli]EFN0396644.1 YdfR family protein [Escherichia coli]EHV4930179.1 YdfR family protein [Escherichia coli]
MKKKYELVVKGINNYPDKITVTVALEIGGYPSLLLPDVAISLDRTEGATLEFYEAEAKKQAKQFFMDVAAGLCEGDGPLPEKRPIILEAQDVLITYRGKLPGRITGSLKTPPTALRSEKDDIESRIEKLECYIAELKKSTPTKNEVLAADEMKEAIPDRAANLSCASWLKEYLQQPEKKRRDEQFAAFYDYCRKVMSRNLAECFSIHNDNCRECNRPSFVVSGDDGKITISENGKVTLPSHQHSETLIEFAIDYLKNNKKQGLMQRIGRCMGYLQVAAEIEALASGADKDAIVREALLRNFNTPPFKKVPAYWLHPGLTYLKVRI